jgi:hypothetical protein
MKPNNIIEKAMTMIALAITVSLSLWLVAFYMEKGYETMMPF